MGYLRRLLELRPWYRAEPDQSVIAVGAGARRSRGPTSRRSGRAMAASCLAYLTFGNPVSIDLERMSGYRGPGLLV